MITIDKSKKLYLVTAPAIYFDETRKTLSNVLFDGEYLIAGSGVSIAFVKPDQSDTQEQFTIPVEFFKKVTKYKKSVEGKIWKDGNAIKSHLDQTVEPPNEKLNATLATLKKAVEGKLNSPVKHTMELNPKLLANLAAALGTPDKIEIQILANNRAIAIRHGEDFGILMLIKS